MHDPFRRDTGIIPVETVAAGTLMMPDGRPVYAASEYGAAVPADGRSVNAVTLINPNDGTSVVAISLYPIGTLMTADGRPVEAVSGTA